MMYLKTNLLSKYLSPNILAFLGNIYFLCIIFIFLYNEFDIQIFNILIDFIISNYLTLSVLDFILFIVLFIELFIYKKYSKQIIHFEIKNKFWNFVYDFLFHGGFLFAVIKFFIDIYIVFILVFLNPL